MAAPQSDAVPPRATPAPAHAEPHAPSNAHWSFGRFARAAATVAGSPWATAAAFATVVVWAACGPAYRYSEDWQLVINTGTTIVTFLMVFLIQHTQNRDSAEIHAKLNELIRSIDAARNEFIALDELSDDELCAFQDELHALATRYRVEEVARRPMKRGRAGHAGHAARRG